MATKEYFQGLKLVHEKMNQYHVKMFSDLPEEELKPINKLMQHETKPWNSGLSHYEFIDFKGKLLYKTATLKEMARALKPYFKKLKKHGFCENELNKSIKNHHGLTDCGYILKAKN